MNVALGALQMHAQEQLGRAGSDRHHFKLAVPVALVGRDNLADVTENEIHRARLRFIRLAGRADDFLDHFVVALALGKAAFQPQVHGIAIDARRAVPG